MKTFLLLLASIAAMPHTAEQIVDLPQDESKYYLTVMGQQPDVERIESFIDSHSGLQRLRNQTHYTALDSRSPMFVHRYAALTPRLPCVRLQDAEGVIVCQASGRNVPQTADGLFNAIQQRLKRYLQRDCPNGQCPWVRPKPEPEPDPQPPQNDPPAQPLHFVGPPDTVPDPEPESNPLLSYFVIGSLGVAGVAGGVFGEWKRFHFG